MFGRTAGPTAGADGPARTQTHIPMPTEHDRPGPITLTIPTDGLLDAVTRAVRDSAPTTRPPTPARPLLDVKGLARHLGVSVRTVESLVAEGAIAVTRVGIQRRFTPEAVDAFLRSNSRRGAR